MPPSPFPEPPCGSGTVTSCLWTLAPPQNRAQRSESLQEHWQSVASDHSGPWHRVGVTEQSALQPKQRQEAVRWARRERVLARPARCRGWDPLGFQPPPGLPAHPTGAETQGGARARASCPSQAGPGQPKPHGASSAGPGPPAARQALPATASVSSCEEGPSHTPRGLHPGSLGARRHKRRSSSPPTQHLLCRHQGKTQDPTRSPEHARLQARAG